MKQTMISQSGDKALLVVREFEAPVEKVWQAWTESELLDQWWAPRPWKAKTKSMDFSVGGMWLYSMVGPQGEESFCRVDFTSIVLNKSFSATSIFCDENGTINNMMPTMYWNNQFLSSGNGTKVEAEVSFATAEDLAKIVEMGFKGGFTMAHGNLDELLAE